ncbi:MAG: hypothetical protein WBG42_11765 [Cryomorphaceae bacterium]
MKKTIQKLVYFTLALASIIAISLAIHIYSVMEVKPKAAQTQLGRIDIRESIDASNSEMIKSDLKKVEGVTHTFLNADSKRLIFSFNPKKHSPEEIFEAFSERSRVNAVLYTPSSKLASSGCPINKDQSVLAEISSLFD